MRSDGQDQLVHSEPNLKQREQLKVFDVDRNHCSAGSLLQHPVYDWLVQQFGRDRLKHKPDPKFGLVRSRLQKTRQGQEADQDSVWFEAILLLPLQQQLFRFGCLYGVRVVPHSECCFVGLLDKSKVPNQNICTVGRWCFYDFGEASTVVSLDFLRVIFL